MDPRLPNASCTEIRRTFTGLAVRVAGDTGPLVQISSLLLPDISLLTRFTVVPLVRVTGQTSSDAFDLTASVL